MALTDDAQVFFNPLEPSYMADPAPHLRDQLEHAPVQQTLVGPWVIFRHADVFRVLRDPNLSVDDKNATETERAETFDAFIEEHGLEIDPDNSSMLNSDPPDHTRLRRLVSQAFKPRTIENQRPRIQEMVDATLDRMEAAGGGDVVTELAFPLPFDVITEMLGMPEADSNQIRDWSAALVKTLDPIVSDEDIQQALLAEVAMDAHLDEVIEWKRTNRADDILTAMIDAEEDGDRLSTKELRDQVSLLFVAGHETTVNLIGTGIFELMRHPDQHRDLVEDPSLDANAVEELLRYVAPVQFSRRIATADIEIDGQMIPKGSFVMTCLATANRDPRHWGETGEELNLRRDGAGQHLSFGSGAHYCLGASLAKLEAQVAIGSFVRRFPDAELSGELVWNGRINLRGLDNLPVSI